VSTSLVALGSGSRGNCFALECEGAVLLIDAGFSAKEITRRAGRAGLDLAGLVGIALTHEHGDHAAGALRLASRHAVPVLTSPGTWRALTRSGAEGASHQPIGSARRAEVGPFTVWGCPIAHDAAEPLAVAVESLDGIKVGVAYDLGRPTAAVRLLLRQLSAIILEANHDEVMLRTSGYPPSVQQRIAGSAGHLSNRAAADLLVEAWHPGLGTVLLAHLSQRCNREDLARQTVHAALTRAGFTGQVHAALQDQPIGPLRLARCDGAQMVMAL
jgi:phosphoribosyl 1,2-cyclic phosphodiesterase